MAEWVATVREAQAELDDVMGQLNAHHGRLVDLCVWLMEHPEQWEGEELWTIEQYLAWRAGVSRATANRVAAIAARAHELPLLVETMRRGELTLDQATPIAKKIPAWAESEVVALAVKLSVAQISRTVNQYVFPGESDESAEPDTPAGADPAPGQMVSPRPKPSMPAPRPSISMGSSSRSMPTAR